VVTETRLSGDGGAFERQEVEAEMPAAAPELREHREESEEA
jgi:hypothetical protein